LVVLFLYEQIKALVDADFSVGIAAQVLIYTCI
jgi:hypothetical protein